MNKFLLVLLPLLIFGAVACEKKEERILPKVGSAEKSEAGEKSGMEREAFIRQAQEEFDELGVKLAELREKALNATGSSREKLNQQLIALEEEQKHVAEKLVNLKSAIGEKWKELKSDFTTSIEKFKQSVKNAV